MKNTILVTGLFALLMFIICYVFIKKKLFKELAVSAVILIISLLYCYNDMFSWHIPTPTAFFPKLFDSLAALIFGNNIK